MSIRIILADDHKMMRDGLRVLIENHADMEVIAQADNGRDAVRLARKLNPDVVIMDINMPHLNGMDAAQQVVEESPETRVLALSMHSDKRFVLGMLKAGVSGYLLKDCAFEELALAIQTVTAGRHYLSPMIAGTVIRDYMDHLSGKGKPSVLLSLSTREREILQMITEGKHTKEIASVLHLSAKTVETHRLKMMRKLDIHSIAELTRFAIREGLTTL